MSRVSLVVMERGSDWPGHVGGLDEVVALTHDDEALLECTCDKLAALRAASRSVRIAVLACNRSCGAAARERRASLARSLLAAVSEGTFGRLVLSVNARASAVLRAELLALVGALMPEMGRATATISVHFKETRA
jgi:hypothetical protein